MAYWEDLIASTNFKWVFVDDGSTDSTFSIISAFRSSNIQIIKLPQNVGKSEALRLGLLAASDSDSDFVGFMDADGAFILRDITSIEVFAKELQLSQKLDMVWGSRVALAGHDIRRSSTRHYLGRIVATFIMWGSEVSIYDTQCGIKLFVNGPTFRQSLVFKTRTRWFFDLEFYKQFTLNHSAKPKLVEFPLQSWQEVPGSNISISKFPSIFREILYIRGLLKSR